VHRDVTIPEESTDGSVFEVGTRCEDVFAKPCAGAHDGRTVRTQRSTAESSRFVERAAGRVCNAGPLRPLGTENKEVGDAFSIMVGEPERQIWPVEPLSETVLDERPAIGFARIRPCRTATQSHHWPWRLLRRQKPGRAEACAGFSLLFPNNERGARTMSNAYRQYASC